MGIPRIDLHNQPVFKHCDYRHFMPEECHVTRVCPDSVLLFILGGCLRFEENWIPVELFAGDWYIQPAGLLQSGPRPSSQPFYFYVHFSGHWLPDTKASVDNGAGRLPLQSSSCCSLCNRGRFDPQEFRPSLDEIWRLQIRQPDFQFGLQALFAVLLFRLSQQAPLFKPADQRGDAIVMEMEKRFREKLTVEQLACAFHYSPDHLIRKVREICGQTPGRYIRNLRLRDACQQLLHTGRTLQEIAEYAGFVDIAALFRAFSQVYGLSPCRWRERERQLPQIEPTARRESRDQ